MLNLELLSYYNPWWKSSRVEERKLGKKREFFLKVKKLLSEKQIIVVYGLRRVGKTTLFYQTIDYLIKDKIDPLNILYFSFEDEKEDPWEVLMLYLKRVLRAHSSKLPKLYLFLDEVQKVPNWADKLKRIYDIFENIKIFASGSAALKLEKKGKESLAGRAIFLELKPLNFKEYLKFVGVKYSAENLEIYKSEVETALENYLLEGGFFETIGKDRDSIFRYFRESILERVVYKDIAEAFGVGEPSALYEILKYLGGWPGRVVEYKNLSSDLGKDWRTVKLYFDYLEYSLLVKGVFNYSGNFLKSLRKRRKYYLSNPAFYFALFPEKEIQEDFRARVVESLVGEIFDFKFFWRSSRGKEVDFVKDSEIPLPVEVKYGQEIRKSDFSGLVAFGEKFKVKKGIMISKEEEGIRKFKNIEIQIIPLYKALLLNLS